MTHLSRRHALALGLGAAACASPFCTHGRAQGAAKSKIIDVHHHYFPPSMTGDLGGPAATWSPAKAVAALDDVGVQSAILSVSTPGIWYGDVPKARAFAREAADYGAKLRSDYPGRFGFFAPIAAPDVDGSLNAIAYAMDTLKAEGIGMITSYDGRFLGDPGFAPILEELNRRKAVVYVHPTQGPCCSKLTPEVPSGYIEFLFDTTRTVADLLYSGSLSRYPDIQWIFSHMGGTIPMLADRMTVPARTNPAYKEKLPEGVDVPLKRLYWDTASMANDTSWAALAAFAPISRIMFGTDYPMNSLPANFQGLKAIERDFKLSPADIAAVEHGNAERLFPQFRGSTTL